MRAIKNQSLTSQLTKCYKTTLYCKVLVMILLKVNKHIRKEERLSLKKFYKTVTDGKAILWHGKLGNQCIYRRKYSTYPVLITKFKSCNHKMVWPFKIVGSLKTLTFVGIAYVTSHLFFFPLRLPTQITKLSCSANLI